MNLCSLMFLLPYSKNAWLIFGTNSLPFSRLEYGNDFFVTRGHLRTTNPTQLADLLGLVSPSKRSAPMSPFRNLRGRGFAPLMCEDAQLYRRADALIFGADVKERPGWTVPVPPDPPSFIRRLRTL
jgi:hypothetical protein